MELDTIVCGDCLDVMADMLDGCLQCVVTSPPYWGLRDYGNPPRIWDEEAGCKHEWGRRIAHAKKESRSPEQLRNVSGLARVGKDNSAFKWDKKTPQTSGQFCHLCNAWRGCLGLEPTPELYVAHLVEIFREVKRVLRDDGTVWLNMGDSYAGSWGNYHPNSPPGKHGQRLKQTARWNRPAYDNQAFLPPTATAPDLKPKDLVGIPWRVAFALQADGWWLRSDIIWHKPNCMPESVRDRPTKAHEYMFLLSKSKRYYYDQDAIREPHSRNWQNETMGGALKPGSTYTLDAETPTAHKRMEKPPQLNPAGRNCRTIWTIPAQPYSGAHFAVFPEALVEPCIKAGSKKDDMVFDPFMGAGTTAVAALKLGRHFYGCDINPEYVELANKRIEKAKLEVAQLSFSV